MPRLRSYCPSAFFFDLLTYPLQRALAGPRRRLLAQAHSRVLEVGVGTGATFPHYPAGAEVVGIDPSLSMLCQARRRAQRLGLKFHPLFMEGEHLGVKPGSFDFVVSSLALCSVADPRRVLAQARSALRPQGKLLLLEHVRPRGLLGKLFDLLNLGWSQAICRLNQRTEALLEEAGFHSKRLEEHASGIFQVLEATPELDRGGH